MYRDDERGQSIQIGAVLLFGALIVALAGYQAFVVPQQNERVEFSHSQTVQNDMQELRNVLASATGEASTRAVSVRLGTRYPDRIFAVNPGPPSGSLRTVGTGDAAVAFEIANAEATGETGDFWTGSTRTYDTGAVVYRPNYNRYSGAPETYVGGSVAFNDFGSAAVALSDQAFVDGNRITLVAVNGSLGRTRSSATSVDVRPVSSSTTTVSVTNRDAASPVTLRLPTKLSEEAWRELLDDQLNGPGGHVDSVSVTDTAGEFDTLAVTMEAGENYTLELVKVGVGTGVTGTERAYLTDVVGNGSTVPEAGTERLVVEVRDSYDNPVSGVTVSANATLGDVTNGNVTTDDDGEAVFRYEAKDSVSSLREDTVNFSYTVVPDPGVNGSAAENVTMTVEIQNTVVGDGSGGSVGSPYDVYWNPSSDGGPDSRLTLDVSTQGTTLELGAIVENSTLSKKVSSGNASSARIDGADVDFAINDSTVGVVSPDNDTSDSDGEVSTTFNAQSNGHVRVYVTTDGGASDYVDINVKNFVTATVIDNFEDGNLDEYGGDTNQYTVSTTVAADGSSSLKAESAGNARKTISSDGTAPALLNYPRQGDTFVYEFRPAAFTNQVYEAGIEFGETSGGSPYTAAVVETGGSSDTFELRAENGDTTVTSGTFSLSPGAWYEVTVEWGTSDVTLTLRDASGTQVATVSVAAQGDGGGDYFAFASRGGTTYYDYARVTSTGGSSSAAVPRSPPGSEASVAGPTGLTGAASSARPVDGPVANVTDGSNRRPATAGPDTQRPIPYYVTTR